MAIKICPRCGGKVAQRSMDCIHCKYKFTEEAGKIQCPECEEWVEKTEDGRCPVCGHYFADAEEILIIEQIESGGAKVVSCKDRFATKVVIPADVTVICSRAFAGLKYLQSVTIPASVEIIEDEAFAGCANLVLEIPKSVKTVGADVLKGTMTEKLEEQKKRRERLSKMGDLRIEGNYVYFGIYPQRRIDDEVITDALNELAGDLPTGDQPLKWTCYDYYISDSINKYMWYIDVELDGNIYRGVYYLSYRPYRTNMNSEASNSYQEENGYSLGMVYWFLYQPIKWRILDKHYGTALVLSETAIDSQQYDHSKYSGTQTRNGRLAFANNYAVSEIRAWLNDKFYNVAFNDAQKSIIEVSDVDNRAITTRGNNNHTCENTRDNVLLLSLLEVTTKDYGFNDDPFAYDKVRMKKSTDYAKSQGCWMSNEGEYAGNCWWWLRSPSADSASSVSRVDADGDADGTNYIYRTVGGVVPAMRIKI